MIDSLTITNVYVAGALTINDLNYPLDSFTTEVEATSASRPKGARHGLFTTPTFFGSRGIHLSGQIMGSGATDVLAYTDYVSRRRTLLRTVMPKNERFYDESCTLDFLFTGMSEHVTINCALDGYPEIPLSWDTGARSPFQLNFKAFDPRFYGATLNSSTLTHNTSLTTVNNAGDIESYPIITITGSSSGVLDYKFRWGTGTSNFRTVNYTASVPSGQTRTIDFSTMQIVDQDGNSASGGVSYTTLLTVRDWWALEPGNNTVTYIGVGGTPAGTTVAISWRNAYML